MGNSVSSTFGAKTTAKEVIDYYSNENEKFLSGKVIMMKIIITNYN